MKNTLRVVVDTNVLVSGLFGITNASSAKILAAFQEQIIILVTSPLIVAEIAEVINRARIVKLTRMSEEKRKEFINGLISRCDVTAGKQPLQAISRDITDDEFLACAVEGSANYIVTGDDDLLVLKACEGIQIVTPREFEGILGI